MTSTKNILPLTFIFSLLLACNDSENPSGGLSGDWLLPTSQIFDGGPGKDGIPALDAPEMIALEKATFMNDEDFVLGIKVGDEVRAYAHPVLDWHEIINDDIGESSVAVTYCPLTGTGIGWNRNMNGTTTTFGVSGLLYNSNLIPYDRNTDSNWSQMLQQSVNGDLMGESPEFVLLVETTWGTWKDMYPESKVTSTNTGHSRNYARYPYGSYRETESLLFPIQNLDPSLPAKTRVLGVDINEDQKAYQFSSFGERGFIFDEVGGTEIVIIGDEEDNFMVAFENNLSDEQLPLTAMESGSASIFADQLGNEYDFFGNVLAGPNQGDQLTAVNSYIGYWFAWASFYPNISFGSR